MKSLLPFIIFLVVVIGLLVFSARARRRQAQVQAERAAQIRVGSEVMTTSGLYGTVVALNGDETVQLSVAPGVEVKWALPAVRDVASLPTQYQSGQGTGQDDSAQDESGHGESGQTDPIQGDSDSGVQLDKPRSSDGGGSDPLR